MIRYVLHWLRLLGVATMAVLLNGCPSDGSPPYVTELSPLIPVGPPQTPFTIQAGAQLIGGPMAQAQAGDQLLANDQIRVIIRQPGKYPGVGSFGGNIIDADLVRNGGGGSGSGGGSNLLESGCARGSGFASPSVAGCRGSGGGAPDGNDQFGVMLPMINVEWTVNGVQMFAVKEFDPATFELNRLANTRTMEPPPATASQILVVHGVIDTYDYLDLDVLEPVARALTGQALHFSPRFDDMNEPFRVYDLKHVPVDAVTAYRLDPGSRAVKVTTTLFNHGETPVQLPVGDFLNGSGELQLLIPGLGFSPPLEQQLQGETPAVIYVGMPGVDVSYGYFYDFQEFAIANGEPAKRVISTSLSYAGVTGVLLGEEFLKLFPLGGGRNPTINFAIPAKGRRTFTRYFVVGDGSAGSVMAEGLKRLRIPTRAVSGAVVDAAGEPVAAATVALANEKGATVVTYRTDGNGRFSGVLPTGREDPALAFGSGTYTVRLEKPGYHEAGTDRAGTCTPTTVRLQEGSALNIQCRLGASGVVAFSGSVMDAERGTPIPARVTIVGVDPSADRKAPGLFADQTIFERPYGIVDILYLNAQGGLGLTDGTSLRLEPGYYLFVVTHGPEYAMAVLPITVPGYGVTTVPPVALKRLLRTPGFISADFHIHALPSPDSAVAPEQRALAAAAEGLDILHSSDHDYLFDYGPVVKALESAGLLRPGAMGTVVGDEISPNQLGHLHAFPLLPDPSRPNNGALDWSLAANDVVGPDPDYMLTVQEIIARIKQAPGGEKVIQVNHISDRATSLFAIAGLVTTTAYRDSHHVEPLSIYGDPVAMRLPAIGDGGVPYPLSVHRLMTPDITAAELVVGSQLNTNALRESALPMWFNLLNLGLIVTATGDSDSHTPIAVPLGLPRNYIASAIDPRDDMGGDFSGLDYDAYAKAINAHRVVVSAGPFIRVEVAGDNGEGGGIGDVVRTQRPQLKVEVTAPEWAWFDTVEIYANTIPTPVDDDGIGLLRGVAADPAHFHAPYHVPHFVYEPRQVFRLVDGTLKDWKREGGVIRATVETPVEVDHDTWIVVFVRGTPDTPGFRPLFPYVALARAEGRVEPELPAGFTLEQIAAEPYFAVPAWAFTNPVFIDVDGDSDNDGHPFEALYVKQGIAP